MCRPGSGRTRTSASTAFAIAFFALLIAAAASLHAQAPAPTERVSFDEAIQRAIQNNPSSAIAAAGILRAQALLTEARANARPQINGTVTTTTLSRGVEFQGTTVTPQNSVAVAIDARMALYAPALWAQRAQAQDATHVAEFSAADTRRQTAFATADAYLTIIARRRVVEANQRARDTARAHFDLAHELEQRGSGSRLNELRAQQEVSTDEGLVEAASLALYQAQEALGVLLVADHAVDAGDEPAFVLPGDTQPSAAAAPPGTVSAGPVFQGLQMPADLFQSRTDLRLATAQEQLAERVLRDSSKDYYPSLEGIFQPQSTYPPQFFVPSTTAQFLLQLSVPIFDSGHRRGVRGERQSALNISKANLEAAAMQARSEVRAGQEAVQSAQRSLASTRAAADQAQQVVNIVNISFRAGASTNIEVIDAERSARDADTAVAVAEDTLRRARLNLLTAIGRFPQ
jgi:outer membrane protein TolC